MPAGVTPPTILSCNASSVPILQPTFPPADHVEQCPLFERKLTSL
jgi:hypothetical protein